MKQALALILASGTLGLAAHADAGTAPLPAHAFVFEDATTADQPLLASDDDDDGGSWFWSAGGGSDDGNGGGSDEGNGGGSDDDDDCTLTDPACAAGNAAPAGTVAPPKNGLFTDGTAPIVKSN